MRSPTYKDAATTKFSEASALLLVSFGCPKYGHGQDERRHAVVRLVIAIKSGGQSFEYNEASSAGDGHPARALPPVCGILPLQSAPMGA